MAVCVKFFDFNSVVNVNVDVDVDVGVGEVVVVVVVVTMRADLCPRPRVHRVMRLVRGPRRSIALMRTCPRPPLPLPLPPLRWFSLVLVLVGVEVMATTHPLLAVRPRPSVPPRPFWHPIPIPLQRRADRAGPYPSHRCKRSNMPTICRQWIRWRCWRRD